MSLKGFLEKIPGYNKLVLPVHWGQAVRAEMKYGRPAKGLRMIGVTGTNGKTTTCFMIWKMLNEAGRKAGLLTTVGWSEDGEGLHQQIEHMTTERVGVLNERIRAIKEAGAEFLVLEVTSHALAQFRTLGIPIEIAVLTNVTHEHLDYHKTFENYRKAKLKLFRKAKTIVINADDKNGEWFIKKAGAEEVITYGIQKGEMRATEIELGATGVKYVVEDTREGSQERLEIRTQIPGRFNVYNSLAAVIVGKKLGLGDEEVKAGIFALQEVEGRMTRVREGQDFEVIVDYAHTPDALEKVFESVVPELSSRIAVSNLPVRGSSTLSTTPLRASDSSCNSSKIISGTGDKFSPESDAKNSLSQDNDAEGRRIIAVHGGAGRRDESTREIRGEILGKYADLVIITEDDSRDEDPRTIAEMFVKGVMKSGKVEGEDLIVEMDRETAIRRAVDEAKKGDLVLILGKGHEKTILRADGAHEFQDIEVAKKAVREKLQNNG